MKKTLISLLCAAAIALPAQAQTAPTILVVDVGAVFNGFGEAQAAQMRFTSAVEDANKEITNMLDQATAVQKEAQDLATKAQNPALTPEAKAQYATQFNDKKAELDRAQANINSFKQNTDTELQQRRQSIVQTQFDTIKLAVVQIAKKRGASLVLNSSGLAVVYADPSMDITKDVLTNLNAGSAVAPKAAVGATGTTSAPK
jgi:outer membrane protein